MRRTFSVLFLISLSALSTAAQSSTQAAPTAKAPVHHPGTPTAIIKTTVGNMTCTLFPDKAPMGVENFVGLATGKKEWTSPKGATEKGVPLYDGTIFHRVIPEFMIQGGDPAGDGTGGSGHKFKNEISDLTFDQPGRLAYANAGPGTNESQFFITEVAVPHLNGGYTIFGQCDEATIALVKQIARMATDPRNDRPFRPVKITHISIMYGTPATAAKPATAKPAAPAKKPAAASSTPN